MVSPSVAYIETPSSVGSGVLIEGGYIVTNAHVTWPFDIVRVAFPDGTEFPRAPVKGWDPVLDVAVIGPLDAPIPGLAPGNGESLPLGADVLLIGYPGGVEAAHPQPTVVRGILSRFRETQGVTFIQADAAIAGGQSGGALVSSHGELIGISGLSFTEAQFSASASVVDLLPSVRRLMAGEESPSLGDRALAPEQGSPVQRFSAAADEWQRAFAIEVVAGATVELSFSGPFGSSLNVYDVYEDEWLELEPEGNGSLVAPYHGLLAVVVWTNGGDYVVRSNRSLIPFPDLDDGRRAEIGQTLTGSIDFPWDLDVFPIRLRAGETIEVTARSIPGDPFLYVYGDTWERERTFDDDSASGGFGTDAKVVYRAPHTGSYHLMVGDNVAPPSGYTLDVRLAPAGESLTPVFTPTPTPRPTATPRPTPAVREVAGWTFFSGGNGVFKAAFYGREQSRTTGEYEDVAQMPVLYVRCSSDHSPPLDVWVNWRRQVVTLDVSVWAGRNTDAATTREWIPSVDDEGSFHPNPRVFLAWLLVQQEDVSILNLSDQAIGATFDVSGLRTALRALNNWTCGGI